MLQNLFILKEMAMGKLNKLLRDERGEVNIVAMVILIGVAVVLAFLFKDMIGNLINSLLTQITNKANHTLDNIT